MNYKPQPKVGLLKCPRCANLLPVTGPQEPVGCGRCGTNLKDLSIQPLKLPRMAREQAAGGSSSQAPGRGNKGAVTKRGEMECSGNNKDEDEDEIKRGESKDKDQEMECSRETSRLTGAYRSRWEVRRKRTNVEKKVFAASVSEESLDDGYLWRKLGQKSILGQAFPRSYYRCIHRSGRGCNAVKHVQRIDEEFNKFMVVYHGVHTCRNENKIMSQDYSEASDEQSFMDENTVLPGSEWPSELLFDVQEPFTASTSTLKDQGSSPDLLISATDRVKNKTSLLTHLRLGNSWTTVEHSASFNDSFQKLLSAFQDVQLKMKIGICGDGGIGKTTLMKYFLSWYDFKPLFDLVLWVTIPKCSPRRKIQNALLQQLPFTISNTKSDDEVAAILHQTLLTRKFVLFLDDVREHVDLPTLGIPSSRHTDSKIILTTRLFYVCESMGMDKIIGVGGLSHEESLMLFVSNVGLEHIGLYGRTIVAECSGLPLMIKVVGRALRTDSIHGWRGALKEMLLATNNLQLLKLGYDRLEEHEMRSCFLFSALYTESKAIKISSLVEYLVDEGFVAGSVSHAHRRGHDIVERLIDVSLLERTDDGLMIEMHDLIRDLALLILSDVNGLQMLLSRYSMSMPSQETLLFERNPKFEKTTETKRAKLSLARDPKPVLDAGQGLTEPPSEKEWEEANMVFLMDNEISNLPAKPGSSQLQTLFLQRNRSLRTIPSSFFENMSSLKNLNLSKTRIKSLPLSVSKLQCLQVLILRYCERLLFLPPTIGDLKQLLVLDAHGTQICQLPDQIGELSCLAHLELCFYGSTDEDECAMLPSQLISKGVISKFSQLKELSIIFYPGDPRWTKIASDVTIEVSNLELCSLSFHFTEIEDLGYFINGSPAWVHRTLTRFNFIVGYDVKRLVSHVSDELEDEYNSQDRCLRFVNGENIPDAIEKVLNQATAFYLDHHLTAQSLTQFSWAVTNCLKFCIVKDCPKIKAIVINSRNSTVNCFPVLEVLSIHYSWNLTQIWVGPIESGSLSRLRRLSVCSCPQLEYILSGHMIAALFNLEELIVVDCQSVTNVVSNDIAADDSDSDEKDAMVVDLSQRTEFKIKVLKLHYLPNLVNIWSEGDLSCLEYVSIYNCPRLRNLNLKSNAEATVKEIKAETYWWNNVEWENAALPAKLQGRVKEIQYNDVWG